MATASNNSGMSKIEEIIDGINDADIPETEKLRLLRQIEKEKGIYSQDLRQELIALFDGQAALERQRMQDNDALLRKIDTETADSSDDRGEETAVVDALIADQAGVAKEMEQLSFAIQTDVRTMEKQEAEQQEGIVAAADQEEIRALRQGLKE